jgi:hypothetical protein
MPVEKEQDPQLLKRVNVSRTEEIKRNLIHSQASSSTPVKIALTLFG